MDIVNEGNPFRLDDILETTVRKGHLGKIKGIGCSPE